MEIVEFKALMLERMEDIYQKASEGENLPTALRALKMMCKEYDDLQKAKEEKEKKAKELEEQMAELPPTPFKNIVVRKVLTNSFLESKPETSLIRVLIDDFKKKHKDAAIGNKLDEHVIAGYMDYDDVGQMFTYFVGCEVSDFWGKPSEYECLVVPAAAYAKFTSERGPMAEVNKKLWDRVAKEIPENERSKFMDIEVYKAEDFDTDHAQFDAYIGLK
jgi:predicted transcriptional regulator YdeE